MPTASVDDYRWLSEAGGVYLDRATSHSGSLVSLAKSLRRELTAQRAHLVMEMAELRQRAREKFERSHEMFFTRQLLEQATGMDIARYKAKRFREVSRVADLCCGIGGDLLGIAEQTDCTAVDRDPVAVFLAELNCRVYGHSHLVFRATDVSELMLTEEDAWHLDPDRRPSGRRTTQLAASSPSLDCISRLRNQCAPGAVKLAPALQGPPASWSEAQREWIGSRGECRQQMVWFGELARAPGQRTSTLIGPEGCVHQVTGQPIADAIWTKQIGRYVFEPHAVVLAADLGGSLAAGHGWTRFSSSNAYWTGDQQCDSDLVSTFEVLASLPFDVKRVKAELRARGMGRLELKCRAISLRLSRLRQQLKVPGDNPGTLLIAGADPHPVVVLAHRR